MGPLEAEERLDRLGDLTPPNLVTGTGSEARPRARGAAGPCSSRARAAPGDSRSGRSSGEFRDDTGHLDGRGRRFPPFVGRALAGPFQRLLDRVGREHPEQNRHPGRGSGVDEPVRDGRRDVLEMRRGPPNQASQTDNRRRGAR